MTDHSSLRQAIEQASAELARAGIDTPRVDAELLACHLLQVSRGELASVLITGRNLVFDFSAYQELVAARTQRIPLQHLTGKAAFRGLELAVGPGVFIPRPETEAVVEVALRELNAARSLLGGKRQSSAVAVDLGTGSGAIALAIVAETTAVEVHGVEVSSLAFAWAQRNHELLAHRFGPEVAQRLTLHQADATATNTLAELDGLVDLVVSNPPYIPPDHEPIDVEVRDHDPEIALYGGGGDGLQVPRAVLNRARKLLRPGGVLVMEHAEIQASALRAAAAESAAWEAIATLPDLTGRDRMLYAKSRARRVEMGE